MHYTSCIWLTSPAAFICFRISWKHKKGHQLNKNNGLENLQNPNHVAIGTCHMSLTDYNASVKLLIEWVSNAAEVDWPFYVFGLCTSIIFLVYVSYVNNFCHKSPGLFSLISATNYHLNALSVSMLSFHSASCNSDFQMSSSATNTAQFHIKTRT